MAEPVELKTALTEPEMVLAYVANRFHGVAQHHIAILYGVTNVGRVNEAITSIEWAVSHRREMLDLVQGRARIVAIETGSTVTLPVTHG